MQLFSIFYQVWIVIKERKAFFVQLIIEHIALSLASILLATIVGLTLAIFISERRKYAKWVLSFINFLYVIPSISMLGLLIPISGIGNTTAIIVLFIYALLPMVRSTYTGLTTIDPKIIEAGIAMGSSRWQMIYKIKVPLAFPATLSAIKNMTIMTIALTGIASFIGAGGLGVAIYRGITTNNPPLIIAGSLFIMLLALLAEWLIGNWERYSKKNKINRKGLGIIFVNVLVFLVSIFYINMRPRGLNIACKPMTEQLIMAHILQQQIERHTDIKVNLTLGVGGGTANIHPAMLSGDFDIYPEYTGTGWNMVLNKKSVYSEKDFHILQEEYQKKYKLSWMSYIGFNNTFGMAIRKELADKYRIRTYSDLTKYASDLSLGAEYDFYERQDGYQGLQKAYGFHFKEKKELDVGLKYDAILSKKVDAITVFTTDARLTDKKLIVLVDDKNFYPSYKACFVVKTEILNKYPTLTFVLNQLNNAIDDTIMSILNAQVELEGKSPESVAREFLQQQERIQ